MAPCALAADAASRRNRYYAAPPGRRARHSSPGPRANNSTRSTTRTMINSVSKKSSDIPMLLDTARCPHACVSVHNCFSRQMLPRVHAISLRLPGRGVRVNRAKLNQDARWFGVFAVDRAGHCLQASKSKLWAGKASANRSWPSTPSAPADIAQKAPSSHTQCTRSSWVGILSRAMTCHAENERHSRTGGDLGAHVDTHTLRYELCLQRSRLQLGCKRFVNLLSDVHNSVAEATYKRHELKRE